MHDQVGPVERRRPRVARSEVGSVAAEHAGTGAAARGGNVVGAAHRVLTSRRIGVATDCRGIGRVCPTDARASGPCFRRGSRRCRPVAGRRDARADRRRATCARRATRSSCASTHASGSDASIRSGTRPTLEAPTCSSACSSPIPGTRAASADRAARTVAAGDRVNAVLGGNHANGDRAVVRSGGRVRRASGGRARERRGLACLVRRRATSSCTATTPRARSTTRRCALRSSACCAPGVAPHLNVSAAPAAFTGGATDFFAYHWNGAPVTDLDAWERSCAARSRRSPTSASKGWRASIVNEPNCLTLVDASGACATSATPARRRTTRTFVAAARAIRDVRRYRDPRRELRHQRDLRRRGQPADYLRALAHELAASPTSAGGRERDLDQPLRDAGHELYEFVPVRLASPEAAERALAPKPVRSTSSRSTRRAAAPTPTRKSSRSTRRCSRRAGTPR